jgi:hypothetical protein
MTFLATAYSTLRSFIETLLEETLFKARPELATQFAEGVSILVTLTALYLILEFVSSAKKIIRAVLVLGWVLLIVAILASGG